MLKKLLFILLICQVIWVRANDQFYEPEDEEDINGDNSHDVYGQMDEEDIPINNQDSEEKVSDERRNLTPEEDDTPEEVAKHHLDDEYYVRPTSVHETTHPPAMSTKRYRVKARSTKYALECYTCTYRQGQSLKGCLDPVKYQQNTLTCHSTDDVCYTYVERDSSERARIVVRGCRSACVPSSQLKCCEKNKCNMVAHQDSKTNERREGMSLVCADNSAEAAAPNAAFFLGVLLLLRTVLQIVFM